MRQAIKSILFMWPDDVIVWLHTQLGAATINHLHAPVTTVIFYFSGTQSLIIDLIVIID